MKVTSDLDDTLNVKLNKEYSHHIGVNQYFWECSSTSCTYLFKPRPPTNNTILKHKQDIYDFEI